MRIASAWLLVSLAAAPALADGSPAMPGREWFAAQPGPGALRLEQAGATYRWDESLPKSVEEIGGRRRVGAVRAAPKDSAEPGWTAVEGGFVARFDVASAGAQGLRVRLDLAGAGPLEVRVRDARGRVEAMAVARGDGTAWGPWTEGEAQSVEVFARARPAPGVLRVGGVVHFDRPLDAKAAGSCTIDTACTTGDAVLDAAIAQRKKSIARISFVDGGLAYVCTGTLINTEKYPTPYFLTASHCIGRAAVAASITSFWFHEASGCGSGMTSGQAKQVAGGMSIDFADPNTDHTLLVMNAPPPSGVVFSGWNAAKLAPGTAVVSLSHPAGDVSKWAQATLDAAARFPEWEQSAWLAAYSRGIIEGGSSGSGLFTLAGGSLQLRGVLSATTIGANGGLTCANTEERGIYNRLDVFYPQVARRLMADPPPLADDHGDRPTEATALALGATPAQAGGRIDYPGDVDVFRIPVATPGTLVVRSAGGMDTVGVLLDADGERLDSNDDAQAGAVDFGITHQVGAGTYYLVVSRWESAGTGPYTLSVSRAPVTDNYTDLWWNAAEPGWGINLNHQGDVLFATLFTYGADGAPDWLVMSRGDRQADGSYLGELYRARGPAFDASPWGPVALEPVGEMRLSFPSPGEGMLAYRVDGVEVSKGIVRQNFADPTTCRWSAFDRSIATNFQDLWWDPDEPGWGINFAHQGDILFATLFTYRADGRSQWLVMSRGERVPGTAAFEGTLYRTTGPPFHANPWRPVAIEAAGTMSVAFSAGNAATLTYTVGATRVTKRIVRQVFDFPATQCEADD